MSSIYSLAFAMTKIPVAYHLCQTIGDDFNIFIDTYKTVTEQPTSNWGNLVVSISKNIVFNWVDIMYESIILFDVIEKRVWTLSGEYMAKILSDIVFKSPIINSWNYKNSDVLNSEWGEPPTLYTGLVHELNEIIVFYDG